MTDPGRYDRQTSLPGVDQPKLASSRALVVGAGGLGSPVVMYLAGAGVGTVDVCDFDSVDLTNVHRQILYLDSDVGKPKSELAARRAREVGVASMALPDRLGPETRGLGKYHVVLDCTDRWSSHDAVISAGLRAEVPVVHGSIQGLLGRVILFRPGGPCWRCLHPSKPSGTASGPQGTLGPVCGVVGSMMGFEALRVLLGWELPACDMAVYDAIAASVTHWDLPKGCGACAAA